MSIHKRTAASHTTCSDHSCSVLFSPAMPVHIFKFVPHNSYACWMNKGLMQGPVLCYAMSYKTSYSGVVYIMVSDSFKCCKRLINNKNFSIA